MADLRNSIAEIYGAYEQAGGSTEDFILIGGNAGFQWYFALTNADHSAVNESHPLDTVDVDLQLRGGEPGEFKARIQRLADAIGAEIAWPGFDDATPELARLRVPNYHGPGLDLTIDLLHGPHGLKAAEIERHAERLFHPYGGRQPLSYPILHPVHVVIALCENFIDLPSKRTLLTLNRIRALLPIVRKYLVAQAAYAADPGKGDADARKQVRKEARWGIQELMRRSATARYAQLYVDDGVDITEGVPLREEAPLNPAFWESEMPALRERIENRRQRVRNRIAQNRRSVRR